MKADISEIKNRVEQIKSTAEDLQNGMKEAEERIAALKHTSSQQLGLLSGFDRETDSISRGIREYIRSLDAIEDTWYHSRGNRAEQTGQLPQSSIGSRYLGEWRI